PQLSFAHPGAGHPTGSSLAELLRQPPARFHQLVEIDAGFDAHALQHICDVFAGHVAGRAFCVGAAAGTGDRTVHHAYTFFEAHEDVRKRLVVGVMEVHGQRLHRDFVRHRVQHCAGFHRRTDTDGIAQRNFVAAKLVQAFRNTHHIADGHFALIWAAEYGGHVAAHPNAFGAGALQHRAEPFDGFVERFRPVLERARAEGVRVRGYVSTVLGCPYQGEVPVSDVVRVSKRLYELGCDEISLGDT